MKPILKEFKIIIKTNDPSLITKSIKIDLKKRLNSEDERKYIYESINRLI